MSALKASFSSRDRPLLTTTRPTSSTVAAIVLGSAVFRDSPVCTFAPPPSPSVHPAEAWSQPNAASPILFVWSLSLWLSVSHCFSPSLSLSHGPLPPCSTTGNSCRHAHRRRGALAASTKPTPTALGFVCMPASLVCQQTRVPPVCKRADEPRRT